MNHGWTWAAFTWLSIGALSCGESRSSDSTGSSGGTASVSGSATSDAASTSSTSSSSAGGLGTGGMGGGGGSVGGGAGQGGATGGQGVGAGSSSSTGTGGDGTCTAPFVVGPGNVSGGTSGLSNQSTMCDFGSTGFGPESVFSFTPASAGNLTVTLETGAHDGVLYLRTVCDNDATVLECSDGFGFGGIETVSVNLPAGTEVFVFADGYLATDEGSYSLSINFN